MGAAALEVAHYRISQEDVPAESARLTEALASAQQELLQLADTLHFLNWIEKTGFTVSQLIDTENGTVKAFWSYADDQSERGHRASMFVDGKFRFN